MNRMKHIRHVCVSTRCLCAMLLRVVLLVVGVGSVAGQSCPAGQSYGCISDGSWVGSDGNPCWTYEASLNWNNEACVYYGACTKCCECKNIPVGDQCPSTRTQVGCSSCPAGKYKDTAGSGACINCVAGKYSTVTGATTATACINCEAGKYQHVSGQGFCYTCNQGTASSAGSTSCPSCTAGKFAMSLGMSVCTNCPAGTASTAVAATSNLQCTNCAAGKYALAGASDCTCCSPGQFQNAVATSTCKPCAINTYSSTSCATGCPACSTGKATATTGASSSAACVSNCALGQYGSSCTNCPAGKFSNTAGIVSETECVSCALGKYSNAGASVCPDCPAGQLTTTTGMSSCQRCDFGAWSSVVAATSFGVCQSCANGKYTASTASSSISACIDCPAGQYAWQTTGSSSICVNCPVGSTSPSGSYLVGSCGCAAGFAGTGSTCTQCGVGTYKGGIGDGVCVNCASGKYSSSAGATSEATCLVCPANSNSLSSSSSVTACTCNAGWEGPNGGTCILSGQCNKGYTGPNGGPCVPCNAGTFKSVIGTSACSLCPAGTKSNAGAGECVTCLAPATVTCSGACQCIPSTGTSSGTISDGPTTYSIPPDCTWLITSGGIITLTVASDSSFQTQRDLDYVYVESCTSALSCTTQLARLHGEWPWTADVLVYSQPWTFTVSGNYLQVRFRNPTPQFPGSTGFRGFAATWSVTPVVCPCALGQTGAGDAACSTCSAGTYKVQSGTGACIGCVAGKYSVTAGATSELTCLSCAANTDSPSSSSAATACTCNAGYTGPNGGVCSACAIGTYKSASGSHACANCGAGAYSTATGMTSCLSCPANSNAPSSSTAAAACTCNAGFTGPGGSTPASCTAVSSTLERSCGVSGTEVCVLTQSSSQTGYDFLWETSQGNPYLAVDGNVATLAASKLYDSPAWFRVDFGRAVTVTKVTITNRQDAQFYFLNYFTVEIGMNPSVNTNAVCVSRKLVSTMYPFKEEVTCPTPLVGQYLIISLYGPSRMLKFAELQVTGCGGCMTCAAGTYKSASGSGDCVACVAGKYSAVVGATDAGTCLSCPANSESLSGSSGCTCNVGFSGPPGGPCLPATSCNPGFTGPNVASCSPCATGTYKSVSGSGACTACVAGKYSGTVGATDAGTCLSCPAYSTSPSASSLASACTCISGYAGPNGGPCSLVTTIGTTAAVTCAASTNCPGCVSSSGTSSGEIGVGLGYAANTYCRWIIASTASIRFSITYAYMANEDISYFYRCSSALNCQTPGSPNTYITEQGGTIPISLPHLTYTANTGYLQVIFDAGVVGSTFNGMNVSWATGNVFCPAGQYHTTTCTNGGSAYVSGTPCSNCLNCAAGKFSVVGGATSDLTCTNCPAGQYSGNAGVSQCMECPSGTYSAATGATLATTCLACPANSFSDGASSACSCNVGYSGPVGGPCTFVPLPCNAGYTGPDGGPCAACGAGTYKQTSGSAACTSCGAGTYSTSTGATIASTCLGCPALTTSTSMSSSLAACVCNAGYAGPGGGPCSPCVAGTYKIASGTEACASCGAGTYSSTTGATTATTCVVCPVNANAPSSSSDVTACACNAGYSGPNGGTCSACVAGTYKIASGSAACTSCGSGTHSSTVGASAASSCGVCPLNSNSPAMSSSSLACTCNAGYSGPDGGPCSPCVAGTYKDTSGSAGCTSCAAGRYSASTGASAVTSCLTCPANSNSPGLSTVVTACVCNAGYTGPNGGTCAACVAGTYKIASGSVACTSCGTGTYSSTAGATAATTCLACANNSNAPSMSSVATACTCNVGYSGPNGGPCEPCGAGTYKDLSGSASCTGCLTGKYSGTVGATVSSACLVCPVNTNSPSTSSAVTACACNAGYTGPNGGTCSPCDAGTYKNTSGSVACISCDAGTYSSAGLSSCVLCPAASSSAVGSVAITNCICNAGFYGANGGPCTACASTFTSLPGSLSASDCGCASNTYTNFTVNRNIQWQCGANQNQVCSTAQSNTINTGLSSNKLVDNIINTYNLITDQASCPWWRIDLGTEKYVTSVEVAAYLNPVYVRITLQVGNELAVNANPDCVTNVEPDNWAFFDAVEGVWRGKPLYCTQPLYGRYLFLTWSYTSGLSSCRTYVTSDQWLRLGEIYINSASSSCASCPANTFNAFNTNTKDISTCWCVPGSYYASSKCNLCERGKFWANGQCSNCPAGTFSNVSGATNSSVCASCLAGTYAAAGSSACTTCPARSSSLDGSASITNCICDAGSTGPNGGPCVLCAVGKYKVANGTAVCTDCLAGTFSNVSGATNLGVCATCLAGTYAAAGSSACTTCPARSSSLDGSVSIANCICDAGSTGPNGGPCVLCAVGKYKVANGTAVCTDCSLGTYSWTLGANTSETCLSCPDASSSPVGSSAITTCTCNAGASGPNGGPCVMCVTGKYKAVIGTSVCLNCSVNTFSSVVGATTSLTCATCAANSQSGEASSVCVCNGGYTGPDGGPCLACVSGTFKPDTGRSACTLCPNNTFSELPASTNASVCKACQANAISAAGSVSQEYCYCVPGYAHSEDKYTCKTCTPGTYNSQLARRACSNCTIGMYSVNYTAISPETCKYCPAGQWSPEGSANCNLCPANSRTLGISGRVTDCVCNRGYTGPSGSTCVACAAGLYKDVTGPDACTVCPMFMSSFPGTERATDCWCVPGYVKVSGVCVEMIPRATQIAGTLKDIASNASSIEIQNATEKLRRNIAAQLNVAIELVQVDRVQNSSNQVQVLLFARSETEVALLERKVRFATEPPIQTLLPFLLVSIGNSSVGEPRVVLITVDIHHEARFASRESEMLFAVTEGMSETLDVDTYDISYVFDESMDMDIPRVIMSVRTPTYDEYVRVLAAANALLAQGNVTMPEMTVQVLTVGNAGRSGLNATYALIRQDGTPMAGHEVSAANETLVRQLSWYYDVPAYDVSVIQRKLENICFKNTSY